MGDQTDHDSLRAKLYKKEFKDWKQEQEEELKRKEEFNHQLIL